MLFFPLQETGTPNPPIVCHDFPIFPMCLSYWRVDPRVQTVTSHINLLNLVDVSQ